MAGETVVLLFTDLVGSTELLDRLGDDRAETLRRTHFRALREAVATRGGLEVKSLGDGLMVVFGSAMDACACAVAMQQGVDGHNRTAPDTPLEVRIGLHAGEPLRDEGDYFGSSVVIAKRLCDAAAGGQILASGLVRALVGPRGALRFKELGPLPLKGMAQPIEVSEVEWASTTAAPADLRPWQASSAPRS